MLLFLVVVVVVVVVVVGGGGDGGGGGGGGVPCCSLLLAKGCCFALVCFLQSGSPAFARRECYAVGVPPSRPVRSLRHGCSL